MLGADVGTTIAAQVLSFDLSWLSPLLIARRRHRLPVERSRTSARHLGRVAIGLGLMLLSLQLLALATEPLRSAPAFMAAAAGPAGEPCSPSLVGTLATWLVHSSLSIVLLVMSFAAAASIQPAARAGAGARRQCRRRARALHGASPAPTPAAAACRSAT